MSKLEIPKFAALRNSLSPLKIIYVLLCFGLCILAYQLGCFFVERIIVWRPLAGIMDWPIFMDYASRYIKSGILYEKNIALYGPGEPIYKFPPLFLSIVIFCFQHGISAETVKSWSIQLHIVLYGLSWLILLFGIKIEKRFINYLLLALIAFSFEPFFDNFVRLQLEIYILFLMCLGIVLLIRHWNFWSGFCFGFAAGLKIYPVFFCASVFLMRNYRALFGALSGFMATLVISLTTVSMSEHWNYFMHIVPFMFSEPISSSNENISVANLALLLNFSSYEASLVSKFFLVITIVIILAGVFLSDIHGAIQKNSTQLEALKITSGFSVLISGFILGSQNIWWNYQLLLIIPITVIITGFGKNYFSWINLLAVFIGCFFIYSGSIGQLDRMTDFCNHWFGNPNVLQPLFVRSVYLRTTASLLIFIASVCLYWRVVQNRIN
jgi:hypothetical protein